MIIHIDNTYIKEYEKDTVINDLCQGKRLNLVVKNMFSLSGPKPSWYLLKIVQRIKGLWSVIVNIKEEIFHLICKLQFEFLHFLRPFKGLESFKQQIL